MIARAAIVVAVAVLALPAPAGAEAALQVSRACFADPAVRSDTVQLTGSGFDPGQAYQVSLDGQPLPGPTGTVRDDGSLTGSFGAPDLALAGRGTHLHTFTVRVQEGANAPTASFAVSTLLAGFTPEAGNPRTLRVRFYGYGFGLGGEQLPRSVYVHYVAPDGSVVKTMKVGAAAPPCGTLARTPRQRLFPFARVRGGMWRLQFDTQPGYSRGRPGVPFTYYVVKVRVR
jgi:hypothetical protein